jgi:hypothetical protein
MRPLDGDVSTQRWVHTPARGLKMTSSARSFLRRVAHRPDVSAAEACSLSLSHGAGKGEGKELG